MTDNSTNSRTDDDIFWGLVEKFIEDANSACEAADPGIVGAALMNAAARFNAFVVAQSSLDKNEFAQDVEGTTQYLSGRYREFLKEHMEDYRENYTALIGVRELPEE